MAALDAVARPKANATPREPARAMVRIIDRFLNLWVNALAPTFKSARRETIIEDDKDNDRADPQPFMLLNGSPVRCKNH
jgi:hypothetical protein